MRAEIFVEESRLRTYLKKSSYSAEIEGGRVLQLFFPEIVAHSY